MLRTWRVLGTICLLGMARLVCASEASKHDSHVTVFVIDRVGASQLLLRNAEKTATYVLRQAGVDVEWVNCGSLPADKADLRCDKGIWDFFLSLVPRARTLPPDVFGVSFLAADSGTYADVFFDPIRQLQDLNHEVSLGTILGLVMAHELGHLLLGSNSHSPDGIMQARWQNEQLLRGAAGRMLFTASQTERMRKLISTLRRSNRQQTPGRIASRQDHPSSVLVANRPTAGPEP